MSSKLVRFHDKFSNDFLTKQNFIQWLRKIHVIFVKRVTKKLYFIFFSSHKYE